MFVNYASSLYKKDSVNASPLILFSFLYVFKVESSWLVVVIYPCKRNEQMIF